MPYDYPRTDFAFVPYAPYRCQLEPWQTPARRLVPVDNTGSVPPDWCTYGRDKLAGHSGAPPLPEREQGG